MLKRGATIINGRFSLLPHKTIDKNTGKEAEIYESSLNSSNIPTFEECDNTEILNLEVSKVYLLTQTPNIENKCFKSSFNYRKSTTKETGIIISKNSTCYLLIGQEFNTTPVGLENASELIQNNIDELESSEFENLG